MKKDNRADREDAEAFDAMAQKYYGGECRRVFLAPTELMGVWRQTFTREVSSIWLLRRLGQWKKAGWLPHLIPHRRGDQRGFLLNDTTSPVPESFLRAHGVLLPEQERVRQRIRERVRSLGISLESWKGISDAAGLLHVGADQVKSPEVAADLQRASSQLKRLIVEVLGSELDGDCVRQGLTRRQVSDLKETANATVRSE